MNAEKFTFTFENDDMKSWHTSHGCILHRLLFGRSNVYLVSGNNTRLLVDTGSSPDGKRIIGRLRDAGRPDAVIMTHTHFDHAGNAGLLKHRFDCKFIVQEREKEYLESGISPIPKGTMGWTRLIYSLGAEKVPHWFRVAGVKADITFGERYDLSHLGLNAYILHTPGHSPGSSCVVIDEEIALVGDTLGGFIPGSVFPPWGDDAAGIIQSWKKLLDTGCRVFHPSHGFAVSRMRLEKSYSRLERRIISG